MIGFGILDVLERPGPPGVLLIVALVLMYVVRPFLDKKAQGQPGRRPVPRPRPKPRPPPDGPQTS